MKNEERIETESGGKRLLNPQNFSLVLKASVMILMGTVIFGLYKSYGESLNFAYRIMVMKYGFIYFIGIAGVLLQWKGISIKYSLPAMTVIFVIIFYFFVLMVDKKNDVDHLDYRVLLGDFLQSTCIHFFVTLSQV